MEYGQDYLRLEYLCACKIMSSGDIAARLLPLAPASLLPPLLKAFFLAKFTGGILQSVHSRLWYTFIDCLIYAAVHMVQFSHDSQPLYHFVKKMSQPGVSLYN